MANKRARKAGSIATKIPVELISSSFEPFHTLKDLDLKKLERTQRTTIELGTLEGGCCKQIVRGVVVRGMVTALEIEPCRDGADKKPPADLVEAVRAAARMARKARPPRPWKPMPVARLAQNFGPIVVESITCWRFCLFGFCITCCDTVAGQIICTLGGVIITGPIVVVFG